MLGQFGDLVDEADLGRQHAVGGVFGQFGAAQAHEHDAFVVAVEGGVQVTHHVTHFIAFTAYDDTVRASAVGHGRTFFQELGVRDDIELQ
ncbi:hypothetical protein D3C86_1241490 [compost metagenome]